MKQVVCALDDTAQPIIGADRAARVHSGGTPHFGWMFLRMLQLAPARRLNSTVGPLLVVVSAFYVRPRTRKNVIRWLVRHHCGSTHVWTMGLLACDGASARVTNRLAWPWSGGLWSGMRHVHPVVGAPLYTGFDGRQ